MRNVANTTFEQSIKEKKIMKTLNPSITSSKLKTKFRSSDQSHTNTRILTTEMPHKKF